jgi:hypothetical protein
MTDCFIIIFAKDVAAALCTGAISESHYLLQHAPFNSAEFKVFCKRMKTTLESGSPLLDEMYSVNGVQLFKNVRKRTTE